MGNLRRSLGDSDPILTFKSMEIALPKIEVEGCFPKRNEKNGSKDSVGYHEMKNQGPRATSEF